MAKRTHDDVLDRWERGESSEEIATAVGMVHAASVRTIVLRARKRGDARAVRRRGYGYNSQHLKAWIGLDSAAGRAVVKEALRRQVLPSKLIRMVVETVARDGLFAAVLDDGGASA
jgi:hypothetical protein